MMLGSTLFERFSFAGKKTEMRPSEYVNELTIKMAERSLKFIDDCVPPSLRATTMIVLMAHLEREAQKRYPNFQCIKDEFIIFMREEQDEQSADPTPGKSS